MAIVNITSDYNANYSDFIYADASNVGFTVQLPPVQEGEVVVKKTDSTNNAVTVIGSIELDDMSVVNSFVLDQPGAILELVCGADENGALHYRIRNESTI